MREAIEYLEYSKDNHWTGEKMLAHTKNVVVPIFQYAFPSCHALFAFYNSSNNAYFSPDALVASRMYLLPGGKQPLLQDGWDFSNTLPQSMVCSENHPNMNLRGQPKDQKQVVKERGLWQDFCADGTKYLLKCPSKSKKSGCDNSGKCCSTALL